MPDTIQTFGSMRDRICAYFEVNWDRYSPQEQERIRKQICPRSR